MRRSNVPAHHMPLAYFAKAVRIKKLTNHGRGWEAFLDGHSLGFSDGSREEAIRDVHHREVNNALYFNDPSTDLSFMPRHMERSMPSAEALADHPDLPEKFASVIASKPHSAWTTPLTKSEFDAYISASYAEMNERIRALVKVPEGHAWRENASDALRWWLGDPLKSSEGGLSFNIGRSVIDEKDDSQMMVEVRYFWQGRTLQNEDGTLQTYSEKQHRVALWCEQGRPFYLQHKSLLPSSSRFFYNDTIEGLATEVAAAINAALAGAVVKDPVGVAA